MGLLNDICKNENIKILKFTEELSKELIDTTNFTGEGRAVVQADKKYIIIDRTGPMWEQKFLASHEIAHHLLGHLRIAANTPEDRQSKTHTLEIDTNTFAKEMEANIFASVLTAFLLLQEYTNNKQD